MQHILATLADGTVTLPYEEIIGDYPGPTITITAGMDGDEFAGIEATHALIEKYSNRQIRGRIRILPIINIFGYKQKISYSPIDHKYPKRVFPGSPRGTHTEQLMHWLYETQIQDTNVWIDLHGGTTEEQLTPFIWLYQSKHADIQKFHTQIIGHTSAPIIVHDRHPFMAYSSFLDSRHIAHALLECGDQGTRQKKDIDMHIAWTNEILSVIGSISTPKIEHSSPKIYTSIQYAFSPNDIKRGECLWKYIGNNLQKEDVFAAYAQA